MNPALYTGSSSPPNARLPPNMPTHSSQHQEQCKDRTPVAGFPKRVTEKASSSEHLGHPREARASKTSAMSRVFLPRALWRVLCKGGPVSPVVDSGRVMGWWDPAGPTTQDPRVMQNRLLRAGWMEGGSREEAWVGRGKSD